MPNKIAEAIRAEAKEGSVAQAAAAEAEALRVEGIELRRLYYEGRQYDSRNEAAAKKAKDDGSEAEIPEHDKLHAYSSHIEEVVDFLADEISSGFTVEVASDEVQEIIDEALLSADQVDDGIDDVLRDGMIAGDVAAELTYNQVTGSVDVRWWDSELVQFVWADTATLERVILREIRTVKTADGTSDVIVREEFELVENDVGVKECRKTTKIDGRVDSEVWLGRPFIPWCLIRVWRPRLRDMRGRSVIKDKVIRHVNRYNAVEQLSYLIARYNSHGNLAVVGDAASIKIDREGGVGKDVGDVVSFPGGTNVSALTLPTDPEMIEHQRAELERQIYRSMGVVNLDLQSLAGAGKLSGYALEIINRKTEATFRRMRASVMRDLAWLTRLIVQVDRWAQTEITPGRITVSAEMLPEAIDTATGEITVRLGSAYIVDDVMVREDFAAGLVSRREALRKRGYDEDEIETIVGEIEDEDAGAVTEAAAPPATGSTSSTAAGSTLEDVDPTS